MTKEARISKRHHLKVRQSILRACDALLFKAAPKLNPENAEDRFVLMSILNEVVWKYSEATPYKGGKYEGCRWWSEGAIAALRANRKKCLREEVALEHVFERKAAREDLMAAKDISEVQRILDRLETCVILRSEHRSISEKGWRPNPDHPGGWWQRYEGKIVRVDGPNVISAECPTRVCS